MGKFAISLAKDTIGVINNLPRVAVNEDGDIVNDPKGDFVLWQDIKDARRVLKDFIKYEKNKD